MRMRFGDFTGAWPIVSVCRHEHPRTRIAIVPRLAPAAPPPCSEPHAPAVARGADRRVGRGGGAPWRRVAALAGGAGGARGDSAALRRHLVSQPHLAAVRGPAKGGQAGGGVRAPAAAEEGGAAAAASAAKTASRTYAAADPDPFCGGERCPGRGASGERGGGGACRAG